MKEETLAGAPSSIHASRTGWVDEVFHNMLWYGCDTRAGRWNGDFRLILGQGQRTGKLALLRLEDNPQTGERAYRVVPGTADVIAKANGQVDIRLIEWLVQHDGRNGYDVMAEIDRAEAAHEKARLEALHERAADTADRIHHAANKGKRLWVVGGRGK